MRKIAAVLALGTTLAVGACSYMPSMPDFSTWFDNENAVEVAEVGRAQSCGTEGEVARVQLLPDAVAVRAWESQRGIQFSGIAGELPAQPYAIVEMGQRSSAGYGIAVSRQAGLKDGILLLKATFIAPRAGAMTAQVITSPCALVSLPKVEYGEVRVIDQTGKLRASSAAR